MFFPLSLSRSRPRRHAEGSVILLADDLEEELVEVLVQRASVGRAGTWLRGEQRGHELVEGLGGRRRWRRETRLGGAAEQSHHALPEHVDVRLGTRRFFAEYLRGVE